MRPERRGESAVAPGAAAARAERRDIDRQIAALALPSLGALLAEPVFLLVDSAMVGHLGQAPLAGLAIASTVLQTFIGLMIFLAYSATPHVARNVGRGQLRAALESAVDGVWLAGIIGAVIMPVGWATLPWLVGAFTGDPGVAAQADAYLRIAFAGVPAMLVVLAATGALRGLQDARTPLFVAAAGCAANVALNAVFIYGLGWGVAGSAAGTTVVQWAMAIVLAGVLVRRAVAEHASLRPRLGGLGASARDGAWLFLRTLTLRAALVATVWLAGTMGSAALAGYQIVWTVFGVLGIAFDAFAVAAQAMIGRDLGVGDVGHVRRLERRLRQVALAGGSLLGVAFITVSGVLGHVFTQDAAVLAALPPAFAVMGVTLPLVAYVYVYDGVLIGAADVRYLAGAGVVNLLVMAAAVAGVLWVEAVASPPDWARLVLVWLTFGVALMGSRAATLGLRARGTAWMRV